MFKGIDLASDTATRPTQAMKHAMIEAPLGDEQRGEDPTTKKLEEIIAGKLGFSAATFFPSATMANQVALMLWCEPGQQIFAAENSHIFAAELGGPAIHAKALGKLIPSSNGLFTAQDISDRYKTANNIRFPEAALISIENTTNLGGGSVWDLARLTDLTTCAKELQLKLHMDGARFFNAAVKLNVKPDKITAGFDSVTICLSKGLGCAAGALLVFDQIYKYKVEKLKHIMGGALRQSGILAAAGIYALEHHVQRLAEDHENASLLAQLFSELNPFIQVNNPQPVTNIVLFKLDINKISAQEFTQFCIKNNFRFSQISANQFRAITHLDIKREDIFIVSEKLKEILKIIN